ncbi:MAG: hypothetical protein ABFD49_08205 [Armatimonadota bacterium]|nr:hypothetical protein [bacterium]
MIKSWKRSITQIIAVVALALIMASNADAGFYSKLITVPTKGTANSLYTFLALWQDDTYPNPSPTNKEGIMDPGIVCLDIGGSYADKDNVSIGIPMYYCMDVDLEGTTYKAYIACVSRGLNMADLEQQPYTHLSSTDNLPNLNAFDISTWCPDESLNCLLWTPYTCGGKRIPVWYASALYSGGNDIPNLVEVTAYAYGDITAKRQEVKQVVTIYDSRANAQLASDGSTYYEMINYGGRNDDTDELRASPWVDPLTIEPSSDGSGVTGDDASGSHSFVFRCIYHNKYNLPPMPWWHSVNYSSYDYMEVSDFGVALYLDVWGIGDYRLIPMMPEVSGRTIDGLFPDLDGDGEVGDAWTGEPGTTFIARIMPSDGLAEPEFTEYDKAFFPAYSTWAYNSLPVGTFNYFFACSDDWLRFLDRYKTGDGDQIFGQDVLGYDPDTDYPRFAPFVLEYQPVPQEWGLDGYVNYKWTIPTAYTDKVKQTLLTGNTHVLSWLVHNSNWSVPQTVDWSQVPSDATDEEWGFVPWTRNDDPAAPLGYSNPPDFTTFPFRANNNPLDPTNARAVTGNPRIDRDAHRIYSSDSKNAFDSTLLVDRPVLVPGKFGDSYLYPATEHPVVGGQLTVPLYDDVLVSYRDEDKYGGGRYYGTLLFSSGSGTSKTFKRAMNPQMDGTYLDTTEIRDFDARRAETAGATTDTECTFQIMYKSRDGSGPPYIKLLIADAESRGSMSTDEYTSYTMAKKDALDLDFTDGVWYTYTTKLPTPGPHNYLFKASDGNQTMIWPRRPDYYSYNGMDWEDWWVPTKNTSDEYMTGGVINTDYDNNDFVPGPYINTAPTLTNNSVTPTSGKLGTTFQYKVLYKDADGQRPYSAKLIITTNNAGDKITCNMLPMPTIDNSANNSALYKAGVYYYYNLSTVDSDILASGTRSYEMVFTDDWGRQVGTNDRIEGQSVTTGVIQGPVVKDNTAPRAYNGSVESKDGSSNPASLWTFSVTYADYDDDAPSVHKILIGQLQPDDKTILWDEGHDLLASDSTDTIYKDGKAYYYQTRLSGDENGKQYYYAFMFNDGYLWATYKSSANSTNRSNAANCFTADMDEGALTRISDTEFHFDPIIAQYATTGGSTKTCIPSNPDDILELKGVYLTEDLTGDNYYDPATASDPYVAGETTVTLTKDLASNVAKVWLKYQARSPILGPLPGDAPSELISDAQVYVGGTSVLVDDLKNGWQRPIPAYPGADEDKRYSAMNGTAVDSESADSVWYVTPDDASTIGSVEGVYDSMSDLESDTDNYYQWTAVTPSAMTGTVIGATDPDTTVKPASSAMIRTVLGVYEDEAMSTKLEMTGGFATGGNIELQTARDVGSTVYIKYIAYSSNSTCKVGTNGKTIDLSSVTNIKSVVGVYSDSEYTTKLETTGDIYYTTTTDSSTGVVTVKSSITLKTVKPSGTLVYIKYIPKSAFAAGDSLIALTSSLPTAGQTVYIKYSDIRFTHTCDGEAQAPDTSGTYTTGTDYFSPDGWNNKDPETNLPNIHIKGNDGNNNEGGIDGCVDGGVIGVWVTSDSNGVNYFDPWLAGTHSNNEIHMRLTDDVPSGSEDLWARYYQAGDYQIDRWNRKIEFFDAVDSTSSVTATYAFGTKMPETVGANTAPTLSLASGMSRGISGLQGESTTDFTYTIEYTDTDGTYGQAPEYVRVYIDDVAYDMTCAENGTPVYRDGATYTYTTKLSANSHTYRFEASDGADVAIYDNYTYTGTDRPGEGSVDYYVDIDGPFVNDRPKLSNASVSPSGTISQDDSSTFQVTYSDSDADEPYFYNSATDTLNGIAKGDDKTGSPRLWIDASDNDTLVLGVVDSLAADPIESSKKRTIVAKNIDGTTPNWTADKFAGKVMQITSGDLKYRCYLISSNTSNTLTVSTDDLGALGDNLSLGVKFTVNGLLMIRQDTNSYASGSVYLLTVPKLAVGSHKYQFTARSRVTMPDWLYATEYAAGTWIPYSDPKVEYPDTASTGPTVVITVPTGNAAPVLSNTEDTALYSGPKVKMCTLASIPSSEVALDCSATGNWTVPLVQAIRQVLGVYWSANAVYGTDDNLYDTSQTFDTSVSLSSYPIALKSPISAIPAVALVQLGTVGDDLSSVIPDKISAIATVTGVYDNSELTGTNYYATTGSLGDSKITLATALPSGTDTVYIAYMPDLGVIPPMYVMYFDKSSTSTVFMQGDPLTFRVNYSDADNDPPAYHDGVTGYLQLVFDSDTEGTTMLPLSSSVSSFTSDVAFTLTKSDLSGGTHKYHFLGSDGYDPDHKVRFPASSANDYSVIVNCKPTLTDTSFTPASGQPATTFTFTATYTDSDYNSTKDQLPVVTVRLTNVNDSTQDPYDITLNAVDSSPVYAKGAVFSGTLSSLVMGTYNVVFNASDGYQDADPVEKTVKLVVRNVNIAPTITSYSVSPAAGKQSAKFVYSATYFDGDNDPPVTTSGTSKVEGLKLIVDGATTYTMTKASSTDTDYNGDGVIYTTSIVGSNLGIGKHTYTVVASDGWDSASAVDTKVGPVVLTPFFDDLRVVSASSSDPDLAAGVSTAVVAEEVVVAGRMLFPRNDVTGKPEGLSDVTIVLTKPDGSTVSLIGSVTMLSDTENTDTVNWVGKVSVSSYPSGADAALVTGDSITLSSSGQWYVSAAWGGDSTWDAIETDDDSDGVNDCWSVVVGGPMRSVCIKNPADADSASVVDMITPPMNIGSGDPAALFGATRATLMQVVHWYADSKKYLQFGVASSFPALQPGYAVWIKPKSSYPTESINSSDYQSGMLAVGNEGTALDFTDEYKLIKVYAKAYETETNNVGGTETAPCEIPLSKGWNQFGNIFFNWKTDSAGNIITPRVDVGIPISELRVKYLNVEYTLAEAKAAGLIRDYAWRWDASNYEYTAVHSTMTGAERVLKAWYGYWIKAFVACDLVIDPDTSYNGEDTASTSSLSSMNSEKLTLDELDSPPPAPKASSSLSSMDVGTQSLDDDTPPQLILN